MAQGRIQQTERQYHLAHIVDQIIDDVVGATFECRSEHQNPNREKQETAGKDQQAPL